MTKIILLIVGVLLGAPVWAEKSLANDQTAQMLELRILDVIGKVDDLHLGVRPERAAKCVDSLQPMEPALADLEMDYAGVHAVRMYYVRMAQCRGLALRYRGETVTVQDLQLWISPWLRAEAAFSEKTPSTSESSGFSIFGEFQLMRIAQYIGLPEQGEAHFHKEIDALIQKAVAQPADQHANDALRFVARLQYGQWLYQSQVLKTQAILEQGLGEGHPASLIVLRAAAYHERFLGRAAQALAYIERADQLTHLYHPTDLELQAHMAAEHAACLSNIGRQAEALPMLLKVRDYFEAKQPTPWMNVTRLNYNLAGLALDIGDYDHAIEYADRSMALARQSGIPVLRNSEIVIPATTKALARLRKGEPDAGKQLMEAIQMIPPPPGTREMHIGSAAFALVQEAARRGDTEMLEWAIAYTDDHIASFRAPLQAESALRPLMQAWREAGVKLADARVRASLDQALAIGLGGRNPGITVLTQFSMARHLSETLPSTAVWLYKLAANQLQTMRTGLPSDDQDLYRSWLSNYEDDLRAFVNLLIDQGRLPEAEQVLQVVRNEELFEFTRRSKGRRAGEVESLSLNPQERAATIRLDALRRQAETAANAADARLDEARVVSLLNSYHDPIANSETQSVQDALHTLLESALPVRNTATAPTLRGTAKLPPRTARLTYLLGRDGMDIISRVGGHSLRHHVPISAVQLNALVHEARAALNNPQRDPRPILQRLWRILMAPVQPQLKINGIHHLQVVPDGTLRYLPFSALHDGKRFLVQEFDLQTQWNGGGNPRQDPGWAERRSAQSILALGRTAGTAQHPPLPGVNDELASIGMVHGHVLKDEAFTASTLRAALEHHPDVVHIASHFVLDPAGEDKSYLLLGDGRTLSLTELKQLPWSGVQLTLLSACDSALAIGEGDGREWTGFANTLTQAGVRNVLASLWRIEDGSTAQWMRLFYTQLRAKPGLAASTGTLASTQRAWLKQQRGGALAHPYYWAPFVWLGAS